MWCLLHVPGAATVRAAGAPPGALSSGGGGRLPTQSPQQQLVCIPRACSSLHVLLEPATAVAAGAHSRHAAAAVAHARPRSSHRWCCAAGECACTWKEAPVAAPPLPSRPPAVAHCLSGGPRCTLGHGHTTLQPLQAAHPSPLPGPELRSLCFSTQPPPAPADTCLRLGSAGRWHLPSVQVSLHSAFCKLVAGFSSKVPQLPLCPG